MMKLYPVRPGTERANFVDEKEGEVKEVLSRQKNTDAGPSNVCPTNEQQQPPLVLGDWKAALWGSRPGQPLACLVRVYVVRAFDLQPKDPNGLADPFVEVKIGRQRANNRSDYQRATLEPVFGKYA